MRYLVQFQINIFALAILSVLYLIMKTRSKVNSYGKTLLNLIMITTAVAIITEPLTWIFDGELFFGAFFLEYFTNIVLFLIGPIIGGLTMSYVDYSVYKNPKRVQDRLYYLHLSILTLFVLIYNIFNPIYFKVDLLTNSFSSGVLKELHYVVLGSLYLYMLYFILLNKNKISKIAFYIFLGFFGLPMLGMVAQLFDSKLHFSWTAIVLAVFVIYVFLESTSNEEDYLTKLYNRKSSELYINHLLELKENFGVILLDLNLFKEINDVYGHSEGDLVLIAYADTLKKVFHKDSLVARIGGDEFIVVIKNPSEKYIQRINEVKYLLKRNDNPRVKNLTFGYGYQPFAKEMTVDELYNYADQKMYADKNRKKDLSNQVL